jgi:hypothetical protein
MLVNDELSTIPDERLDSDDRLNRVDFLAATISNLAFDVAGIGDPQTVKSLLDIGWMLTAMRQDLAMDCSSANITIIDNAVSLIRTIKTRCEEHGLARTIH